MSFPSEGLVAGGWLSQFLDYDYFLRGCGSSHPGKPFNLRYFGKSFSLPLSLSLSLSLYIYIYIYIYIYMCVYICVCMCVCVCDFIYYFLTKSNQIRVFINRNDISFHSDAVFIATV